MERGEQKEEAKKSVVLKKMRSKQGSSAAAELKKEKEKNSNRSWCFCFSSICAAERGGLCSTEVR